MKQTMVSSLGRKVLILTPKMCLKYDILVIRMINFREFIQATYFYKAWAHSPFLSFSILLLLVSHFWKWVWKWAWRGVGFFPGSAVHSRFGYFCWGISARFGICLKLISCDLGCSPIRGTTCK